MGSCYVQGISLDPVEKTWLPDAYSSLVLHNEVKCPCWTKYTKLPQSAPNPHLQPHLSPLLLPLGRLEPRINSGPGL
jgi:hypothetical protein